MPPPGVGALLAASPSRGSRAAPPDLDFAFEEVVVATDAGFLGMGAVVASFAHAITGLLALPGCAILPASKATPLFLQTAMELEEPEPAEPLPTTPRTRTGASGTTEAELLEAALPHSQNSGTGAGLCMEAVVAAFAFGHPHAITGLRLLDLLSIPIAEPEVYPLPLPEPPLLTRFCRRLSLSRPIHFVRSRPELGWNRSSFGDIRSRGLSFEFGPQASNLRCRSRARAL